MELLYHEGNNFGDSLNPIIFNYFLGEGYFSPNDNYKLLGIGSILGLKQGSYNKIVFSSGYAAGDDSTYGKLPNIDSSYEILCVRGPRTAKILGLDSNKSIADGAIILPKVLKHTNTKKKNKFGLILHHKSYDYYSKWSKICNLLGIVLIDVRDNPEDIVLQIVETEFVIAEAMHGAIIADSYRVPWTPIKFYPNVNEFKWYDYAESLNIKISFIRSRLQLHNIFFYKEMLVKKGVAVFPKLIASIYYFLAFMYVLVLITWVKNFGKFNLSEDSILKDKQDKLIDLLFILKQRK